MNNIIAFGVVLLLPADSMDDIMRLIKNSSDSPIILNTQNCLPHITVAMGSIHKDDFNKIIYIVTEIANKTEPFEITISHLKQVKIETGQVFGSATVDIMPELTNLRLEISEKLNPLLSREKVQKDMFYSPPVIPDINLVWAEKFLDYQKPEDYHPHITLGEGEIIQPAKPIKFTANNIAISHLGNYFTCRKVLQKFDFGLGKS